MLKLNHKVLFMDCAYKTKLLKMLLYIIIGVTLLNTTYYVIFIFLLAIQLIIILSS